MDSLSLFGLVLAIFAIAMGTYLDGGQLQVLLNLPALLIVLGGSIGAVILQTPADVLKRAFKLLKWVFKPPHIDRKYQAKKIVKWSKESRKEGLLFLEKKIASESLPFTKFGLEILTSGYQVKDIRNILELEITNKEDDDLLAVHVFECLGRYAPTIGIIGAVLGLIDVMRNLSDPSHLGAGIAVAFVATIYGVGFANILFLPMANKIRTKVQEQNKSHEMITEGLVSIADGVNPSVIQKKLNTYL